MNRAALLALALSAACAPPARVPATATGSLLGATAEVAPPSPQLPPEGEPADVTAVCARVPCREVAAVGQRMPFAFETDVIVAQDEAFSVGGEVRDGLLLNLRANPGSGPTVAVSWTGDRVTLANGYPRRLRYRAMVLSSPQDEFDDLEVCAIGPGQVSTLAVPTGAVLFALTALEHVSGDTFDACERR